MTGGLRQATLPALAIALVCSVLGIQLAHGGGQFETLRPADPCVPRTIDVQSEGIDGLVERLIMIGIDDAACTLRVSREALVLDLGQTRDASDVELDAVRRGLLRAVAELKADGTLPKVSEFKEEILDIADLNGVLEALVRALPNSVIDGALQTDDLLVTTINDLDLRAVLGSIDDQSDLEQQIEEAVLQAAKDSLIQQLKGLV